LEDEKKKNKRSAARRGGQGNHKDCLTRRDPSGDFTAKGKGVERKKQVIEKKKKRVRGKKMPLGVLNRIQERTRIF